MDTGDFKLKDAAGWQRGLDANRDPYGAAVFSFAERWARAMQKAIDDSGRSPAEVIRERAEDLCRWADTEGITGFMYGAAVSMLAQAWEHGEELRRWHNLDIQCGDEGERANESGGVLNPALLSVGKS
jgi:hypothetical protein